MGQSDFDGNVMPILLLLGSTLVQTKFEIYNHENELTPDVNGDINDSMDEVNGEDEYYR